MELQTKIKERLTHVEKQLTHMSKERQQLITLMDIYQTPLTNGHSEPLADKDLSRTDKYRHYIRQLMKQKRSWHITDIQEQFEDRGLDFNKGLADQVIRTLREEGEVLAVKINRSNQKYYYMSPEAANGSEYKIKDKYLPIPKEFIESIEVV